MRHPGPPGPFRGDSYRRGVDKSIETPENPNKSATFNGSVEVRGAALARVHLFKLLFLQKDD